MSSAHRGLHHRGRHAVRLLGELGHAHRLLLLLHHAQHHRVWGHRARDGLWRLGSGGEASPVRALPGPGAVPDSHVLQPCPGGCQGQVQVAGDEAGDSRETQGSVIEST